MFFGYMISVLNLRGKLFKPTMSYFFCLLELRADKGGSIHARTLLMSYRLQIYVVDTTQPLLLPKEGAIVIKKSDSIKIYKMTRLKTRRIPIYMLEKQ